MSHPIDLQLPALRHAYDQDRLTPMEVVAEVFERIEAYADPAVWITLVDRRKAVRQAGKLAQNPRLKERLPLYGVPFAVKDNIDVAGLPTTAACPAFAYLPEKSATAVQRLLDAGAILIGKTNLDQFATGLVGVRSPHGAPRSVFDPAYISGGSSSGSAVAVAAGLVSFSLGTDTAGSGRVPAAFNNLVGVKPTKGLVSTSGVVPACRSLDCVTVFAANVGDADLVRQRMQGNDDTDPYSRPNRPAVLPTDRFRFGILPNEQREFFGDTEAADLYQQSIDNLTSLGGTPVEFNYQPFKESAALLYSGPWVAERYAAIGDFLTTHPNEMDPTVRTIIERSGGLSAVDAFRGQYALQALKKVCRKEWNRMDLMLLPTTPTTYRVDQVLQDPIQRNSILGTYTNFVNLLDCCAAAVPAGFRPTTGLPFGVTLIAPAFCDDNLAVVADRLHRHPSWEPKAGGTDHPLCETSVPVGTTEEEEISLAVVGAHLSGQPLNHQLTSRGATLQKTCTTAADYRLYALSGTTPPKPGLVRDPHFQGEGVEVEIWQLSQKAFGAFTDEVPEPLGIGNIHLDNGTLVKGFICEPWAIEGAEEITHFGGWRSYLAGR